MRSAMTSVPLPGFWVETTRPRRSATRAMPWPGQGDEVHRLRVEHGQGPHRHAPELAERARAAVRVGQAGAEGEAEVDLAGAEELEVVDAGRGQLRGHLDVGDVVADHLGEPAPEHVVGAAHLAGGDGEPQLRAAGPRVLAHVAAGEHGRRGEGGGADGDGLQEEAAMDLGRQARIMAPDAVVDSLPRGGTSRSQELVARLFRPVDGASLVFVRVAFGLVVLWEAWRYADNGRIFSLLHPARVLLQVLRLRMGAAVARQRDVHPFRGPGRVRAHGRLRAPLPRGQHRALPFLHLRLPARPDALPESLLRRVACSPC